MNNCKNFRKLLQKIESDNSQLNFSTELNDLEIQINDLFFKIKKINSLELASDYFDLLGEAQSVVSKLIFDKELEVSNSIWKFFKDFDRIDDNRVREYIFQEIKNGRYALTNDGFLWYR